MSVVMEMIVSWQGSAASSRRWGLWCKALSERDPEQSKQVVTSESYVRKTSLLDMSGSAGDCSVIACT